MRITVGGRDAKARPADAPPISVVSSSLTILTTVWPGLSWRWTSAPRARSLTAEVNCLTTLKLTSASSSARRISRMARVMSSSVSAPRPRTPERVSWSFSERESNTPVQCRCVRLGRRRGGRRRRRGRRPRAVGGGLAAGQAADLARGLGAHVRRRVGRGAFRLGGGLLGRRRRGGGVGLGLLVDRFEPAARPRLGLRWRRALAASAEPAERAADVAKRLVELARDDEDLVRLALRELRQHLQVLVAQELLVGRAVVDRLEDGLDRLRLALGAQDRRRARALGLHHRRLLLSLGCEDLRFIAALRGEDRRAAVALGAHLLLHRLLH